MVLLLSRKSSFNPCWMVVYDLSTLLVANALTVRGRLFITRGIQNGAEPLILLWEGISSIKIKSMNGPKKSKILRRGLLLTFAHFHILSIFFK